MAGKLIVGSDGKVTGDARIEYNSPFPCVNGSWGSGAMMGVVMHTMVGNLPGTVSWFNNPQAQASAHFGIAQDGTIHQFGPIGKGWVAWHAAGGNKEWYGIEHADDGNPNNPLTDAMLTASAQLVECLADYAGFPIQISDSPSVKGYICHFQGGSAWSPDLHSCPDSPPNHVRSSQRPEIIKRAQAIHGGTSTPPTQPPTQPPVQPPATAPAFPYPAGHYIGKPSPDPHCHSGCYGGSDATHTRTWQQRMRDRGWSISVDGCYGDQSRGVCLQFQQEKHLAVDGLVGPNTWSASWTAPVT
jgi:hypothetical protein